MAKNVSQAATFVAIAYQGFVLQGCGDSDSNDSGSTSKTTPPPATTSSATTAAPTDTIDGRTWTKKKHTGTCVKTLPSSHYGMYMYTFTHEATPGDKPKEELGTADLADAEGAIVNLITRVSNAKMASTLYPDLVMKHTASTYLGNCIARNTCCAKYNANDLLSPVNTIQRYWVEFQNGSQIKDGQGQVHIFAGYDAISGGNKVHPATGKEAEKLKYYDYAGWPVGCRPGDNGMPGFLTSVLGQCPIAGTGKPCDAKKYPGGKAASAADLGTGKANSAWIATWDSAITLDEFEGVPAGKTYQQWCKEQGDNKVADAFEQSIYGTYDDTTSAFTATHDGVPALPLYKDFPASVKLNYNDPSTTGNADMKAWVQKKGKVLQDVFDYVFDMKANGCLASDAMTEGIVCDPYTPTVTNSTSLLRGL